MNRVFLLRQSCGENHCPKGLWRKGTNLCFTYSPYSSLHVAVTCALLPLSYNHSKQTKKKRKKKKKRMDVSCPTIAMELSIYGRCESLWMRTFFTAIVLFFLYSTFDYLVCRVLTRAEDELFGFSVATFLQMSNCGKKTPQFISTDGLHWHQAELKSLPFPLVTETERDMLEVLLKRVNVFVYKCVYWLNLCVYTG